uniref:hypothetical protein n=1 Tax=Endozoicomonas sp. SESOKO3 TaxID=2828744 RepID=UPI002148DFBD
MHFYRLLVVFVLSLHAIAIAPLCNSSTIVDWHNPGGQKVRLEINGGIVPQVVSQWQLYSDNIKDSDLKTGQTLNNTVTLAGDNLAGSADLPGGSNGGFFYSFPSPPSCSGGGGWLPLERIALKTHLTVGIKAGNDGGKPSGKVPDEESKDENNDHQKEQRDEPGGQESRSPGQSNDGSGNNRKDDNGEENEQNATTQDLQELANQLIALIECGDPNAVFMLREILDVLDMPQRLQVLETTGTNARGNPVTPLEAILELQRSVKKNSLRNRFIKQLIEATSDKTRTLNDPDILFSLQPIIPPARALPETGVNNLRILYKIVQDIIRRINQSDQQTLIGQFEKYCFIEYFLQLFLLYSNPLEPIRELLGKISDSVISRDIVIHAQTLTLPISFRDAFIELEQHPSRHESAHLSNELIRRTHTFHSSLKVPLIAPVISHSDNTANATTASNAIRFTDSIRQVNGSHSASGSGCCSPDFPTDRYLQQGARPKRRALANQ